MNTYMSVVIKIRSCFGCRTCKFKHIHNLLFSKHNDPTEIFFKVKHIYILSDKINS